MRRGKKFNIAQFRKNRQKKLCEDVDCPDDKICNPKTGKCVNKKSVIGKKLVKISKNIHKIKPKKLNVNMKAIRAKRDEDKKIRDFFNSDHFRSLDEDKLKDELLKFGEENPFRERLMIKITNILPEHYYITMIDTFLDSEDYLDTFFDTYILNPEVEKEIKNKAENDEKIEERKDIIEMVEEPIEEIKVRPKKPMSSYLFFRQYMLKKIKAEESISDSKDDEGFDMEGKRARNKVKNGANIQEVISEEWVKAKKNGKIRIWEEKARAAEENYFKRLSQFNKIKYGADRKYILEVLKKFFSDKNLNDKYGHIPSRMADKFRRGELTIEDINKKMDKKFGVKDLIKSKFNKKGIDQAAEIMKKINKEAENKKVRKTERVDNVDVPPKQKSRNFNIDPASRIIRKKREELVDAPWLEDLLSQMDLDNNDGRRRIQTIVIAYAGNDSEIPEKYYEYFKTGVDVKNPTLLKSLGEIKNLKKNVKWYYPSNEFYKLLYVSKQSQDSNTLKLIKLGNKVGSSFYLVYVTNKMEAILQNKKIAKLKNNYQNRKNLNKKQIMLDLVKRNIVSEIAKEIARDYFSESLLAINSKIGNYRSNSNYISELIEEHSNNFETISEFFKNCADILVYIQNPEAKVFREKLELDDFTPETLSAITIEEMSEGMNDIKDYSAQKNKIYLGMVYDYYYLTHPSEKIELKIDKYPFGKPKLSETEDTDDEYVSEDEEIEEKKDNVRENKICPDLLEKLENMMEKLKLQSYSEEEKGVILPDKIFEVKLDKEIENLEKSESLSETESELSESESESESESDSESESESESLSDSESDESPNFLTEEALSDKKEETLSSSLESSSSSEGQSTSNSVCAKCGKKLDNDDYKTKYYSENGKFVTLKFCCLKCMESKKFSTKQIKKIN